MKLGNRTVQILKNFSSINPSVLFREGTTQATVSPQKTMLARATLDEEFPQEFAIFDLSRFLGVLSLFNDPELEFEAKKINIKQGGQKVDYTFADPDLIVVPPNKTPQVNTPEVSFELTADNLNATMKAMGVLQSSHLFVEGDGTTISIGTCKPADPTADQFRLEVGSTEHTFRFTFKAETMKILPDDYEVQVSSKNIAHLKSDGVEYWIMADANHSSFKS
jgi:hypothetical protein